MDKEESAKDNRILASNDLKLDLRGLNPFCFPVVAANPERKTFRTTG